MTERDGYDLSMPTARSGSPLRSARGASGRSASTKDAVPSSSKWPIALPGAAVFLIALILYLPSLRNGYTGWDDTLYIVNNPHMVGADGLSRIWASPESEQYYPLTFTSFWLEFRLWGSSPMGYHATNAVLHALNSLLVLILLRTLGLSLPGSLAGALLFAVHPVQVMSVAWIAERKNLLSCLFSVMAILAWIRSYRKGGRWIYVGSVVCFALAMLSKTAVLGLPLALIVLDRMVLRARWPLAIARALPMLVTGGALTLVTIAFERKFIDAVARSLIPALPERLQIAGAAPWFYVRTLLLPIGLSPAYPLWHVSSRSLTWWLPLAATVLAFAAVAYGQARIDGRIVWGAAHFAALLAPSLGIIAFANLAVSYVSDHYLYVASIGACTAAGLGFEAASDLAARRSKLSARLVQTGSVVLIVVLALASLCMIPYYRDTPAFWGRVIERSPDNHFANAGLAAYHLERGNGPAAASYARRAVATAPNDPDSELVLARALILSGDLEEAEERILRLLSNTPNNVSALAVYGAILERTNREPEARDALERAVRIDGRNVDARLMLADFDFHRQQYSDAASQFQAVLSAQPGLARAHLGLLMCRYAQGDHAQAVEIARAGLLRAPGNADLLERLAFVLATSRDDSVRSGAEAVAIMEPLCARARGNPYMLATLAAAYAEAGRFDDAVRTSEESEQAAESKGDPTTASRSRERTGVYARHEALRQ